MKSIETETFEESRELSTMNELKEPTNHDAHAMGTRDTLTQFCILFQREFLGVWRDRVGFMISIILSLVLSSLFGGIFWQVGKNATSEDKVQSRSGAVMFFCITLMFSTAQPTVLTFQFQKPVFVREYMQKTYSLLPYFLAKVIMDLPKVMSNLLTEILTIKIVQNVLQHIDKC